MLHEFLPLLVDLILLFALAGTAIGVLVARELYTAVMLFIIFGLLMALVWVRLQAPDLALAEAAIGAGLTGVLFLDALGHLKPDACGRQPFQRSSSHHPSSYAGGTSLLLAGLGFLLAAGLTGVLWWSLIGVGDPVVSLNPQVLLHLSVSGVDSPVTAVLLTFRAYDTLLEVSVILVAAVVGLALRFSQEDLPTESRVVSPLLRYMLAWLLPLMVMVSVYLIWMGSVRHGGAFQAAAVLAAMAVLMRMAGVPIPGHDRLWVLRLGLAGGLSVFLLAGSVGMISGGAFLAWPQAWAGMLILLVEVALTFSLGMLLFSLFEASPAPHQQQLVQGG